MTRLSLQTIPESQTRTFKELGESGLLWLINSTVFHPRGYALALVLRDGEVVGWQLHGDGTEPWVMPPDIDEAFQRVSALMPTKPSEG